MRRLAANLLNQTKGWSSLRWGRASYTKTASWGGSAPSPGPANNNNNENNSGENKKAESAFCTLCKSFNAFCAIIRTLVYYSLRILQFITNFGSFVYGVRTATAWVKLTLQVLAYAGSTKYALETLGYEPYTTAKDSVKYCLGYSQ